MTDRDVSDINGTRNLKRDILVNGTWHLNQDVDWNHNSSKTFRSGSVDTIPLSNGAYYKPTVYRAFFSTGSVADMEVRWLSTAWRRLYGSSASSQAIANSEFYGFDTVYPHEPLVPGYLISRAENKVNNQIRNNQFNLGQTLGELPQTVKFVADTMSTVFAAWKAAKRLDWRAMNRILTTKLRQNPSKKASELWLQYQYAWKPLIQDVYNVCDALSNGLQESNLARVASSELEAFDPPTLSNGWTGTVAGEFEYGVEVGVTLGVANKALYDLNRMGLLNPAALAWELFPLSFVFDWFVPVGNFLESLGQGIGLSFGSGYRTLFGKVSYTARYLPSYINESTITANPNFQGRLTYSRNIQGMNRSLYTSFPMPVPYWDPQLNLSKITSMLALAKAITSR